MLIRNAALMPTYEIQSLPKQTSTHNTHFLQCEIASGIVWLVARHIRTLVANDAAIFTEK